MSDIDTTSNTIELVQPAPDMSNLPTIENPQRVGKLVRRTVFDLTEQELARITLMSQMYEASSFNNSKNPQSAGDFFLIMMKGLELGVAPMAAVDTINIISGKPTLDAKGMLAIVKSSGLLENIDIDSTKERCIVTVKRKNQSEQIISFTIEDAKQFKTTAWVNGSRKQIPLAEKDNWKSQPEVMLKWRAVTKAMREVFPDILSGLYTQEELEPDLTIVNEDGSMEIASATKKMLQEQTTGFDDEAIKKIVTWANERYGLDTAEKALTFIGKNDWSYANGDGKKACEVILNVFGNKILKPILEWAKSNQYGDDEPALLSLIEEKTWAFAACDIDVAKARIEAAHKELEAELADEPTPEPTWSTEDKDVLESFIRSNFDKEYEQLFELPEEDFPHDLPINFANADEAIAKLIQAAIKHNWDVISDAFTVTNKQKGAKVTFKTILGDITIFSRTKLAEMIGEYYEQHEEDVSALEAGDYAEMPHVKINWEQKKSGKVVNQAYAFDPYADISP